MRFWERAFRKKVTKEQVLQELVLAGEIYNNIAYENTPPQCEPEIFMQYGQDLWNNPPTEYLIAPRYGLPNSPQSKLIVFPENSAKGYSLRVHTNDIGMSEELQVENDKIKERIEAAWKIYGLPVDDRPSRR